MDEFEAVRLLDYEGNTQEQCARQMRVSRTTVTDIYARARGKIADALVNGKALSIAGGHYELCDGSAADCCGRKCNRRHEMARTWANTRKEAGKMKIAVTYENGNVFQHFGHTEKFKVYEAENGKITDSQVISTNGSGHGALAGLLASLGVDTLICGGIGAGAQAALAEAGIELYGGVTGNADEAVTALLAGELAYQPDVHCDHNHHGEGHSCGENHSCGEDKHGCAGN